MILPDICYLHHYNILKQTKLNTRIALVKQTLNWRALRQRIPLKLIESWSRRLTASYPMFTRKNTKPKDRRYSLVHQRYQWYQWYLFSLRIPSGDAPEVVACRWLQENKDGWSNLIHVAILGPQERAVVSICSICGCGITIIYIYTYRYTFAERRCLLTSSSVYLTFMNNTML